MKGQKVGAKNKYWINFHCKLKWMTKCEDKLDWDGEPLVG